ncbi:serine/threonine protein kinase [Paraliomyxa miuraensis]|uniref:serine/threonine protein kinase n=1 Tax=Paraliomyxa miuraensis TaxID=376150 RepID=UPI00225B280F|nr:serine/threonine-protein kinase [Paraliomyxa miuraensis]MCX4241750.1 serine/threonine protein kinase [Paraliomyxa miuraensis]
MEAGPESSVVEVPRGFEDLCGQVLRERYAIDELVGSSPQRAVFGGSDRQGDGRRAVLVTVVRPTEPHDSPTLERFERRVAACGRVRHPVVITPTDHGELLDGKLYLVTDRPPGEPLDRLVTGSEQGRIAWAEARPLLLELVQGIGAAHARKVVHGALSPRCCWVELGAPTLRVIDFGANTSPSEAEGEQVSSRTTAVSHDAVYMAPEVAGGMLGDERADVYLVGLVAWFVLVGRPPFSGGNPFQLMTQHLSTPAPAMVSCGADVPEAVEAWVRSLLAKGAGARPASMAEVEQALLGLDEGGQVVGAPRAVEPVAARGRKGRARARQARASALLGDGGAQSREEAVRRLDGGVASVGRARRLPGQEIVDARVAAPRREAAASMAAAASMVAPTSTVPEPAPVVMPAAVVPEPAPVVVPAAVEPEPAPVVVPADVVPEPAPVVMPADVVPEPAPVVMPSASAGSTTFLSRNDMLDLHWQGRPPAGVEAAATRSQVLEVEATTMLSPDVFAEYVGAGSAPMELGPEDIEEYVAIASAPTELGPEDIEEYVEADSAPMSSRLPLPSPRLPSLEEATMMLRPEDIEEYVETGSVPSSGSPSTMLLTKDQLRALRAGFLVEPSTPSTDVGSVPPAGSQPTSAPVITGATQRVSPELIRALRSGALSGELHASGPNPLQSAEGRCEERTQYLSITRQDAQPALGAPAAHESTQALSPEEIAAFRQSFARPGSRAKEG